MPDMRGHGLTLVACLCLLLAAPLAALAQSGENVAVVINDKSLASQQIGEHYVRSRAVPAANVIHIQTPADDTIDRAAFARDIEAPIAQVLRRYGLQDRILYIVLTKGVPLRIAGTDGQDGTIASVDSELTLLYRRMTGREVPVRGRVDNPYHLADQEIGAARPFSHRTHDIYLVTRLDGYTVDDVIGMIDRAKAPSREGRFVLDQRAGLLSNPIGDNWLEEASRRLADLGLASRVTLESTTTPARNVDGVMGYYSWGSNDPQNRARRTGMRFVPGAVAATFVSTDARTFEEPPADWEPTSNWDVRSSYFGGSPQTLIGDLIREGATGVAGHVAEPYLQSTIRPEILFPAYARGLNLAEAFYLAMPHLSWQTVVVGDPLCAPFERATLTRADIEGDGLDAATELPAFFAARRQDAARAAFKGAPAAAVDLVLRAQARFEREDKAGGREALEQATKLAPELVGAQVQLGMLDDEAGNHAAAAERYRAAVKAQSNNVVALNNLAYHLAVRDKNYAEALPLAERAVALVPNNPTIVDTLAWIEHLSGNTASAARRYRVALTGTRSTGEVHLHAAIVFADAGDLVAAREQLQTALALDPTLAKDESAMALQGRLK